MPEEKREIIPAEKPTSSAFKDLTGKVFGELTVKAFAGKTLASGRAVWQCYCECGTLTLVRGDRLKSGKTRSCGHLITIHGHTQSAVKKPSLTYNSYRKARERCVNSNHENFKNYGGRGIEFRFRSFADFLAEVGERPDKSYTIDRIDSNGHYEKGNLKWSTWKEQRANRRTDHPTVLPSK